MADKLERPARALRSQLLNAIHHACSSGDLPRAAFQLCWVLDWVFMASDGNIYAGQDEIAAELGWEERQARRLLAKLEQGSFLVRTRRGHGQSNIYRFNYEKATRAPFRTLPGGTEMSAHDRTEVTGQEPDLSAYHALLDQAGWQEMSSLTGQECPPRADIWSPLYKSPSLESESLIREGDSASRSFPHTVSDSVLKEGLYIWNAMRGRIGADGLDYLRDSHARAMRDFIAANGLDGWRAVVEEIERDPGFNGDAYDPPNPVRLGKALLKAPMLLERAMSDERYTPRGKLPPTDDSDMLL